MLKLPLSRLRPTSAAEPRGARLPLWAVHDVFGPRRTARRCWKAQYGLHQARFSPASFCRSDHLGDPCVPLADAVRGLVEDRTAWRPIGPIRLLTLLRNWGHYFSPLNLYYCFDRAGQTVEAVVAEVTNTPWHERHWYVLWHGNRIGEPSQLRFRHPRAFTCRPS